MANVSMFIKTYKQAFEDVQLWEIFSHRTLKKPGIFLTDVTTTIHTHAFYTQT